MQFNRRQVRDPYERRKIVREKKVASEPEALAVMDEGTYSSLREAGYSMEIVANDGKPNHLWINQKDGTFREEAVRRGEDGPRGAAGGDEVNLVQPGLRRQQGVAGAGEGEVIDAG